MSHLTDKAANGSNTNINSKKQTVTANGIVSNTNGGNKGTTPTPQQTVSTPTINTNNNNSTPSMWDVIDFNSDYYKNQNSNNSNNEWNGGTQSEWEANFGEDDNDSYLDQVLAQYAQAQAAQKAAIQAAVDQSVNELNAQKTTTAQDYADAYRQLYLNNMKSQKNIGQQMAAQGKTGGASESTLLGLNTNYEDNLRQGKVAEQNALSELDRAITNAQLSGSIEAANTNATTAQNNANAYLTAWQNALSQQQAQAQLEASANSENRQYNYQMAMAMLQAGSMPSDQLLLNAGISKADAQTIVAQVAASKTGSGSGSNTKKATTNNGVMKYGEWGNSQSDYDAWNTLNANVKNSVLNGDKAGALKNLNDLYTDGTIDWTTVRRLKNIYNLGE